MTHKKQQVNSIGANQAESEVALDDIEYDYFGVPPQTEISKNALLGDKLKVLSRAFDSAPDAIQISNLSGHIVYANKAIKRIYGFTPEEQVGKHVGEMSADSGFADKHVIPSVRKTGSWEGEVLGKHRDGRTFPVWLAVSVVKDDKGKPMAITGITRDISEHKRVEASLSMSENKYRTLLGLAPDAIFVVEVEKGILV